MAVSDQWRSAPKKQFARIVTCDPTQRQIEAQLRDGGLIRIAVYTIPPYFRWPKVDEVWTVCYDRGNWTLDQHNPQANDTTSMPIERLKPGEALLDADKIRTPQALTLLAYNEETLEDHQTLRWNASTGAWESYTDSVVAPFITGQTNLVGGFSVVHSLAVTANSLIFLTPQTAGPTAVLQISQKVPGISFTVRSSNDHDERTVAWLMIEPS